MNKRQLSRIFERLAVLAVPFPAAAFGAACGGTAVLGPANAGSAGIESPSAGAPSSQSGAASSGGSSAGSVEVGGSSAGSVGVGGASAGSMAVGGSSTTEGGGSSGGVGGSNACAVTWLPPVVCGTRDLSVSRSCVDPALAVVGGALPSATCVQLCASTLSTACSVAALDSTSLVVNCLPGCVNGRRPGGLCAPLLFDAAGPGAYFAEVARLESASVDAFRILRGELRAHGAPKRLVRAAERAARDEARHTRAMGALARHFGAKPRAAQVAPGAPRSLEAMALENVVEGCVRETYGALLATWQARTARDPLVRAAMKRIARDETEHAGLSWSVAGWLERRLDGNAKRRVERAKQAAVREVLGAAEVGNATFADSVGLPSATVASRLALELERALWS